MKKQPLYFILEMNLIRLKVKLATMTTKGDSRFIKRNKLSSINLDS